MKYSLLKVSPYVVSVVILLSALSVISTQSYAKTDL